MLESVREVDGLRKQLVHIMTRRSVTGLVEDRALDDPMENLRISILAPNVTRDFVSANQNCSIDFCGSCCPRWRCTFVLDSHLDYAPMVAHY